LGFLTSLITLIASFPTNRKFKVLVKGEFSKPENIAAGMPEGSVLAPALCSLYTNDGLATPETHLAQFADDIYTYMTENNESHVL
jgi:hypothetical protein